MRILQKYTTCGKPAGRMMGKGQEKNERRSCRRQKQRAEGRKCISWHGEVFGMKRIIIGVG